MITILTALGYLALYLALGAIVVVLFDDKDRSLIRWIESGPPHDPARVLFWVFWPIFIIIFRCENRRR